jgi:hypothetical protein
VPSHHAVGAGVATLPGKESASASVTAANRIGIGPGPAAHCPRNRERISETKREVSNPQIGPALAMLSAAKEGMTSDSESPAFKSSAEINSEERKNPRDVSRSVLN